VVSVAACRPARYLTVTAMRQPPPPAQVLRFPIVGGLALLAIGVTLAWWSGRVDISPLREGPEIRQGQVWRLVTPVLPHVNVMHLAFNVYWLWVFGTLVEEVFGHARTLAIILVLALGSCAAEYAVMEGGVGLSGVGYGLFGMLWVLSRRDARFEGAIDSTTTAFLIGWFFLCIVTTVTGVMPVANVAHGVGAALGALLGLGISSRDRARRALCGGAVALALAAGVAGAVFFRRWVNLTKDRGQEWARVGFTDLQTDREEDAVKHLRLAVSIDPQLAWAWYNLGVACDRQGHYDEAARAFDRAAQINPGDPDYRKAASETARTRRNPAE
jgi:GlpG protein